MKVILTPLEAFDLAQSKRIQEILKYTNPTGSEARCGLPAYLDIPEFPFLAKIEVDWTDGGRLYRPGVVYCSHGEEVLS